MKLKLIKIDETDYLKDKNTDTQGLIQLVDSNE